MKVINLLDSFYPKKTKPVLSTGLKISLAHQASALHKFLNRPRVINNRSILFNFSSVIVTLLFLITCFDLKNQSPTSLRNKYFLYHQTDIIYYRCLRI
jgi:hypothetical protein